MPPPLSLLPLLPEKHDQGLGSSLWSPAPLHSSHFCYHFRIKSLQHLVPIFELRGGESQVRACWPHFLQGTLMYERAHCSKLGRGHYQKGEGPEQSRGGCQQGPSLGSALAKCEACLCHTPAPEGLRPTSCTLSTSCVPEADIVRGCFGHGEPSTLEEDVIS